MRWPEEVRIWEVGPRDGLQNESTHLATNVKIAWIDSLVDAGCRFIEATSFVSPKWIPALADADEVCAGIVRRPGVVYCALAPNERGLERAMKAGMAAVAVFLSASDTHNLHNVNRSTEQSLAQLEAVIQEGKRAGLFVRAYVSTAFGCPYEGDVPVARVAFIANRLLAAGADEISLGDTIGVAVPAQTERMLERLLREIPAHRLALHMHDTRGMALANILVGMELGITTFDAALGGLGGCPYAPGAAGNVATDDLHQMFAGSGVQTGLDEAMLRRSLKLLRTAVGHPLHSRWSALGGL